jgi:hypothetical protein
MAKQTVAGLSTHIDEVEQNLRKELNTLKSVTAKCNSQLQDQDKLLFLTSKQVSNLEEKGIYNNASITSTLERVTFHDEELQKQEIKISNLKIQLNVLLVLVLASLGALFIVSLNSLNLL